jgi:hypothetical protein
MFIRSLSVWKSICFYNSSEPTSKWKCCLCDKYSINKSKWIQKQCHRNNSLNMKWLDQICVVFINKLVISYYLYFNSKYIFYQTINYWLPLFPFIHQDILQGWPKLHFLPIAIVFPIVLIVTDSKSAWFDDISHLLKLIYILRVNYVLGVG